MAGGYGAIGAADWLTGATAAGELAGAQQLLRRGVVGEELARVPRQRDRAVAAAGARPRAGQHIRIR